MSFFKIFQRIYGAAVSPHYTCYIRTDYFLSEYLLYGSEDRFVEESPPLHDYLFAGFFGIPQFYHFIKSVFYHGIGKSRGYIAYIGSFLLRLLYH